MNLRTSIRPISYIKTHAAEMLKQINDTQNPIVITQNGEAKGVLLDTEEGIARHARVPETVLKESVGSDELPAAQPT